MKWCCGVVLTVLLLASNATAYWTASPHGDMTVLSVAADSTGERILISTSNGVWLTSDTGVNWTQINDRLTDSVLLDGMIGLAEAVDPVADTLIVNAKARQPLNLQTEYHSYDGGVTWVQFDIEPFWPDSIFNLRGSGDHVSILRAQLPAAYFARSLGFGISYGSDVWNVVDISGYINGLEGMFFEQSNPDTVFLYGYFDGTNGGIIVSYDQGWHWHRLTPMQDLIPGSGFIVDLTRSSDNGLIALVERWEDDENLYLLRSVDDGLTWSVVQPQNWPTVIKLERDICGVPERPGRLLLGSAYPAGVWESNDYGETWDRVLRGLPLNAATVFDIYRNPYSGQLYVGFEGQGLYQSTDHGDTWHQIPAPPCGVKSADWHALRAGAGGIAQTTEMGDVWVARDTSTTFVQIDIPVYANSFCAGQVTDVGTEGLLYSHNRWPMWDNNGGDLLRVFTGRYYDFSTSEDTMVLPELTAPDVPDFIFCIESNGDSAYVASGLDGEQVFVYDPDGQNWVQRDTGFYFRLMYAHEEILSCYVWGGNRWQLAQSSDFGETWNMIELPVFVSGNDWPDIASEILFQNQRILIRIGVYTWVYETGEWEQRGQIHPDEFPLGPVHWELASTDNNLLIIAGSQLEGELRLSYDGGWTWESQPIDIPDWQGEATHLLKYDPWRDRLWIDTGGGLAYMNDPTSAVGEDVWVFKPANYLTVNAYPNPFNSSTTITYSLAAREQVTVNVYDLLGRKVETLVEGWKQPGSHNAVFDARGLATGTYYLRVNAGDHTSDRKLVLVK